LVRDLSGGSRVLGQAQVIFIQADGGLMSEQGVDLSGLVFFWSPQMASLFDFFSGPGFLLDPG
jgi:hypothetical protein